MTKRKYRSHAEWLNIIQQYKDSNLTPADYCHQQGLDYKYFLKRKQKLQANVEQQASGFVKLQRNAKQTLTPVAELLLQYQNMTLKLLSTTDPLWLAQLMKTLS